MTKLLRHVFFAIVWSQSSLAAAPQGARTEIHWATIPGCPTESQIIRLVEERLGQPVNTPREHSLRFDAKLTRSEAGEYELVLSTEGQSGPGQRRISHLDCAKVAEAAALVIAIAIDPKRVEERSAGAEDPNASDVSSTELAVEKPPGQVPATPPGVLEGSAHGSLTPKVEPGVAASKPATKAPPLGHVSVSIEALGGAGILPTIDLGLRTRGTFVPPRADALELRLGMGAFLPQSQSVASSDNGRMLIMAGFVDASLCAVPVREAWRTELCAGAEVGVMSAHGRNLEAARSSTAAYTSGYIEVGQAYRVGPRMGVVGSVTAGVGVLRPKFGVRRDGEPEEVYRPGPTVVRLGLGMFWDLR